MTGQHEGAGEPRLARLRARLTSRGVQRGLLIAGFATIAWLAGSAAANADSGPATELEHAATPVLAQAIEIAPVPDTAVTEPSTRALDSGPAASTVDKAASETPDRVLRFMRPVTAPLPKPATPDVLAPLDSAARPVAGELAAVTTPVDGTVTRFARPVAADADPITAVLPWAKPGSRGTTVDTGSEQSAATAEARPGDSGWHGTLDRTEPHHWVADGRPAGADPVSSTARPGLPGTTAPGGIGAGSGPGGAPTHDLGAGLSMSAVDARAGNAGTSRVNPLTAATGQLPDHVEDPAVSPD